MGAVYRPSTFQRGNARAAPPRPRLQAAIATYLLSMPLRRENPCAYYIADPGIQESECANPRRPDLDNSEIPWLAMELLEGITALRSLWILRWRSESRFIRHRVPTAMQ
jgi:hypothetical protein